MRSARKRKTIALVFPDDRSNSNRRAASRPTMRWEIAPAHANRIATVRQPGWQGTPGEAG